MANQPHILLITTDEQRFDTYGAERSDWPQTDNIARLRREGATLTSTYSNCPICMPCRYTWLTGLRGCQTERGCANGYDWPDYQATMPQALQRSGYHTALIGKLHAHTVGTLARQHLNDLEPHAKAWGFDTVYECSGREIWSHSLKGSGGYGIKGCHYTDHLRARGLYDKALADCIVRDQSRKANNGIEPYQPGVLDAEDTLDGFLINEMCRFVETYDPQKPLFLHASFFAPHYPLDVPSAFFNLYRPEDMPPPVGITDAVLIRRWQENRAMYMALTHLVDSSIGRLLDTVAKRGWLDDLVVLFTTDHGDMLGDHNYARKLRPHEGSSRTPILVRHPGHIPAGTIRNGLAESLDLPHTILDYAGLSETQRTEALPMSEGMSFRTYAEAGGNTFRDSVLVETGDNWGGAPMRMLRMGDWKYVRDSRREDYLCNLAEDPYECVNRLNDPDCAARLRTLQECLIDRMAIRQPPIQGKFRQMPSA